MDNFLLGLLTGGSLILAIGPQNLFVIEQGLKKNFVFSVTTICAVSDILLILLGIFIYNIFDDIPLEVETILNILLILFLIMYIKSRILEFKPKFKLNINRRTKNYKDTILKTLGFTYLNPHVYSDTVFIIGNLSKNFTLNNKIFFALGASLASIIFFYSLGYLSSFLANSIKRGNAWNYINKFIIIFMSSIVVFIIYDTYLRLF